MSNIKELNKHDYISLFNSIHPNFFESENIRNLPDDEVYEEMFLPLNEFDINIYDKDLDDSITFGFYDGNIEELKKEIAKVDRSWVQFYNENLRIYCGYIDGKVASFCIVGDDGLHNVYGCELKIGGPGCVGTLPEYRHNGVGLTMIKQVTQILKEEGYDYSYIHYTGVAPWYEKLGYKTSIKWNKNGVM